MPAAFKWFIDDLWDGLRARRGPTALALLAIGIGMVALTLLAAVLGGLQQRARQIVGELGAQVIVAVPDGAPGPGQSALTRDMASVLARGLPACRVSGVRHARVPVLGAGASVPVLAADEHLADIRQWRIRAGRWLDRTDREERYRHAVISGGLADATGWSCGELVLVRDTAFLIVGICEAGGDDAGAVTAGAVAPGERAIFVPLSVPPYWEPQAANRGGELDAVFIRAPADGDVYAVRQAAQRILEAPMVGVGPLSWLTPDVLLAGLRRLQRTVQLTAGSIALLCLLLGGATLMSLMVAAVNERVHEIGLRRSLGATPGDIAGLFAAEACLVTFAAAVIGTGIAHLVLWLAADSLPVPIALGPASWLLPASAALVLGAGFAYAPARRAAAIAPAEALRNA